MEALFNAAVNVASNIVVYLSVPVAIRYLILRRPIRSRWIAIAILVPLFVGFATLIGVQREERQRQFSQQLGIPYRSTPHIIGSPILYAAMVASYFILRGGRKKPRMGTDDSTACPRCNAELSKDAVYCSMCGKKISDGDKAAG
jgi:hypothetical protein